MKINLKDIQKLEPCKNRLDNYIKFYGNREFTPNQFMGLKNITHQDKLWVAFRLIPTSCLGKAAGEIALSVLPIYEKQYPNDSRPRKAIEACIAGTMTPEILRTVIADSHAACSGYYAVKAAIYAFNANDSPAYSDSAAKGAAAISHAISALYAVRSAADAVCASHDQKVHQKLIRKICLKYWKR